MIRPLIVAPHYLFENVTNGQLERTFVNNLPRDYAPIIVCEKPSNIFGVKNDNSDVYEIKRNNLINAYQGLCERFHIFATDSVPDRDRLSCVPEAIRIIRDIIDRYKINYIHTISMPCSSHLIGKMIKAKYNIPWIAQFYDPWLGNPTRQYCAYATKIDKKYEEEVALNADIIIQPNESLKDFWTNSYGCEVSKKIKILPFIANVNDIGFSNIKDKQRLNITHIGGLSNERNTSVFIRGLKKCVEEHPEVRNKVLVSYVGDVTRFEEEAVQIYRLNDIVRFEGRLPENQCAKFYEDADVFLIVDLNCTPNLFYPSKLVKYFCYKKPILGLVIEGGTVQKELVKTKNHPYSYYDIDGVSGFIYRAITDYQSICTNDTNYLERFDKRNVIHEYDTIVRTFLTSESI